VDDSPQSASVGGSTLGGPELPAGWHQAEPDDWGDADGASRRRWLVVRATAAIVVVVGVLGVLVWVAAGHYSRGVAALEDRAYLRAIDEFASAKVLVFPYRDSSSLADEARRALQAETAAHEAKQSTTAGIVALLGAAQGRLEAGDADGVLATLDAIGADDLRSTIAASDSARESAAALGEGLVVAATAALQKAEWQRAGRFAAALLVLEPASEEAAALADRASTGQELKGKLAEARDAAARGNWREALRLALAVVAVRREFPGAAELVADARKALAPKPRPAAVETVSPPAPAPDTGGPSTVTPPQPAPP
jgi:hypothetical protein